MAILYPTKDGAGLVGRMDVVGNQVFLKIRRTLQSADLSDTETTCRTRGCLLANSEILVARQRAAWRIDDYRPNGGPTRHNGGHVGICDDPKAGS